MERETKEELCYMNIKHRRKQIVFCSEPCFCPRWKRDFFLIDGLKSTKT